MKERGHTALGVRSRHVVRILVVVGGVRQVGVFVFDLVRLLHLVVAVFEDEVTLDRRASREGEDWRDRGRAGACGLWLLLKEGKDQLRRRSKANERRLPEPAALQAS